MYYSRLDRSFPGDNTKGSTEHSNHDVHEDHDSSLRGVAKLAEGRLTEAAGADLGQVQSISDPSTEADCSLRQGARPLKGTYKGDLFGYFLFYFSGPYGPGPGP